MIPKSIKKQIENPKPDIKEFINVILSNKAPQKVHLVELYADVEIMKWVTENVFGKTWIPLPQDLSDKEQCKKNILCEIEYWYRMGYDFVKISGGLSFQENVKRINDTSGSKLRKQRAWANMNTGPIQTREDFETYPWPRIKDENFWMYEFAAKHLPDGMGLVASPTSGFFEIPAEMLFGYETLALKVFEDPELVKDVFEKTQNILLDAYSRLLSIPRLVGFFQGDDMGFKTGTLMSPDFLRQYVLPGHKRLAGLAHSKGLFYFLHSCGMINSIMDDLIENVKIDGRHSFEDAIMPIEDFYQVYGHRVAVLGGLDVHLLASASENQVRQRCRQILQACGFKPRFAFGSGNTIANYCKIENVLAMFDEAFSFSG